MRFSKADVFVNFLKLCAWHIAQALSVCVNGEPQLTKIKCYSYAVFLKCAVLVKLQYLRNENL